MSELENRAPLSYKSSWLALSQRYSAGEYRARICADLIRTDIPSGASLRMLDIGCGRGFFDDAKLQQSLAKSASQYIGVEPDESIQPGEWVNPVHRAPLELSPIEPASIDLAFSAMVLEHLNHPEQFFGKLYDLLRPGGVFWGFTVDARHWFARASMLAHQLHIKNAYLEMVQGRRGDERYENYEVVYAANKPADLHKLCSNFASCDVINLSQPGQLDFYFPAGLRWVGRAMDRVGAVIGMPGTLLAMRLVR